MEETIHIHLPLLENVEFMWKVMTEVFVTRPVSVNIYFFFFLFL